MRFPPASPSRRTLRAAPSLKQEKAYGFLPFFTQSVKVTACPVLLTLYILLTLESSMIGLLPQPLHWITSTAFVMKTTLCITQGYLTANKILSHAFGHLEFTILWKKKACNTVEIPKLQSRWPNHLPNFCQICLPLHYYLQHYLLTAPALLFS